MSFYSKPEYTSHSIMTVTTILFALNLIMACSYFAFPSMIFDIGEGARLQARRTAVWSFIILVLVAGIAISFVSDWLKILF